MLIKIKHFGKIILIEMLHFMSIGANYIYLRRYFFVSRVNSQKPMVVLKHINILWHSILKKLTFNLKIFDVFVRQVNVISSKLKEQTVLYRPYIIIRIYL